MTTLHIAVFLMAFAGMYFVTGYLKGLIFCAIFAAISAMVNLYQFHSHGDLAEGEVVPATIIFWLFSMFALSTIFVGVETARKIIHGSKRFFKPRIDTE